MSREPIKFIENLTVRKIIFLTIITMLCVSGLVGSDLYLPMLPEIGSVFGKNVNQAQWSLSIYLIGLSIAQIVHGPLCDKFGRKKMAVFGVSVYFFASIACVLSSTFVQFLGARFLQALGAACGLVVGRAIIGDVYDKQSGGKIFSTIFPFVGMSPAVSPVVGGFLGVHWGWQACFWALALFCLVQFLLILLFLNETIKQYISLHPVNLLRGYTRIICSLKFWGYAFGPCFGYAVYFGYIAESPFIFSTLGFRPDQFGLLYISLSVTYIIGNLIGKKLLNTKTLDTCLRWGYLFFLLGGAGFSGVLFHLPATAEMIVMLVSISIATFANGFLLPLGTAGVMAGFPAQAGLASGLLGFFQLGSAAGAAFLINIISKVSIPGLFYFIFPVTLAGFCVFYLYSRVANAAATVK